MHILVLILYV